MKWKRLVRQPTARQFVNQFNEHCFRKKGIIKGAIVKNYSLIPLIMKEEQLDEGKYSKKRRLQGHEKAIFRCILK
jgi:hypothetical protein